MSNGFKLTVVGGTATTPAAIMGNGAVGVDSGRGRLHVLFVPPERLGAMVLESPDGSVTMWKGAHRSDAPNGDEVKDVAVTAAVELLTQYRTKIAAAPPSSIVGRWTGEVVFGPAGLPTILLVRKMNYATIVVASEGDGKWSVAARRDPKWYAGKENIEKKGFASMDGAISEGLSMVDKVIADACMASAKSRRAALDPEYAGSVAARRKAKGKGDGRASLSLAEQRAEASALRKAGELKIKIGSAKAASLIGTQRRITLKTSPNKGFAGKVTDAKQRTVEGKKVWYVTLTKGAESHTVALGGTRPPSTAASTSTGTPKMPKRLATAKRSKLGRKVKGTTFVGKIASAEYDADANDWIVSLIADDGGSELVYFKNTSAVPKARASTKAPKPPKMGVRMQRKIDAFMAAGLTEAQATIAAGVGGSAPAAAGTPAAPKVKRTAKPGSYQAFVGEKTRGGMSMAEVAVAWTAHKAAHGIVSAPKAQSAPPILGAGLGTLAQDVGF